MPMRNTLAATVILAATAFASTAPARAQTTNVRFVLDFLLQGQQSAFVLGRERGYYTAQKVNLAAFDPGRGGADSITKVASGTHDIGFGDLSAIIEFNSKSGPNPYRWYYRCFFAYKRRVRQFSFSYRRLVLLSLVLLSCTFKFFEQNIVA